MNSHKKPLSLLGTAAIVFILLAVLTGSASAEGSSPPAGASSGGRVLRPYEQPKGWSLQEAAAITAIFNETLTEDALPEGFPFQILYIGPEAFTVRAGTMFYVPVVYSDNMDSALWPFPDVNDPAAVRAYYFDPAQLGAEYIRITVDGRSTNLGPGYAVGAETPGLPTGGDKYTVVAAFLSPMTRGAHTVTIAVRLTGDFIALYPDFFPDGAFQFESSYTVHVH